MQPTWREWSARRRNLCDGLLLHLWLAISVILMSALERTLRIAFNGFVLTGLVAGVLASIFACYLIAHRKKDIPMSPFRPLFYFLWSPDLLTEIGQRYRYRCLLALVAFLICLVGAFFILVVRQMTR